MPPRPKPGSKADRDALRTELLAVGAPLAAISAEMRARFGCRPREAWRHAHGWTLQEAADRFNALAGAAGPATDASLLGKWERWPAPAGRRVTLPVLTLLADLYSASLEDLLDLEDRRALPEADLRLLRHQTATPGSAPTAAAPSAPEPVAPLTGTALIHTAADESAQWAQWAEVTNCGPVSLDQFGADTRRFASDYLEAQDPLAVFGQTRRLLNRVWELLYGHQHLEQRQKLFTTAGYLSAMMAWMTSDLGHRSQAETHARAAMLCADMAGNPGLHAWTWSTRSKLAFWDGQFRAAIQHAERGAAYQAPGTVSILLHCQSADAWAEAGARAEAQAALGRAQDAAELGLSTTLHDQVGGLFSCLAGRHANYGAAVHLRGGSASEALAHADRGLAALRQQRVRALGTEAQLHITRAGAHLLACEPEGVLDALGPVLALPAEHRTAPVRRRLRDLARDTAASPMGDSGTGRRLQDAIETAVREAARALSPVAPTDAWIGDHD
ncbi:XRE family transcriptional regulator [Kitasatospora sp. NPDC059803]|uniref:XRE family transcriptional regulator n=1 Tax=Kitasatospora sp. NPDC059803 TaxID=3346953 RepID=UPI003647CC26